MRKLSIKRAKAGFTLIELVVVLVIIGAVFGIINLSSGTIEYWQKESFVRKLSEILEFLHHNAIADQKNYRIEFYMGDDKHYYKIGLPSSEGTGTSGMPNYPSLSNEEYLPKDTYIVDIKTARGIEETSTNDKNPYLNFHKRGFSDFGVIHLGMYNRQDEIAYVTILVNPFTGLTKIYREYRDFEYTYKKNEES